MKLNIRKVRRTKKMSMLQLSKRIEVSRGYLSELETGKYKNPSIRLLCKIKNVLGCTIDELVDSEDDVNGNKDIHSP